MSKMFSLKLALLIALTVLLSFEAYFNREKIHRRKREQKKPKLMKERTHLHIMINLVIKWIQDEV